VVNLIVNGIMIENALKVYHQLQDEVANNAVLYYCIKYYMGLQGYSVSYQQHFA
jgi:hypothetical protein